MHQGIVNLHIKPLPKFLTLFAGPLFNFILALVLFIGLAYYQGTPTPTVKQLADNYPAQEAGLKAGDKIVQVGHYKINDFSDIQSALNKTKDHQTTIKIVRDGHTKSLDVTPKNK